MKTNMLFFVCFAIFIYKVSLTTYYNDVDLEKYGKITVPVGPIFERFIIFDSSGFSKGSKIYFKITATEFSNDKIDFEFYDDPNDYTPKANLAYVYPTDTSTNYQRGVLVSVTNYYTIEKSSRNLGVLLKKWPRMAPAQTWPRKFIR